MNIMTTTCHAAAFGISSHTAAMAARNMMIEIAVSTIRHFRPELTQAVLAQKALKAAMVSVDRSSTDFLEIWARQAARDELESF